MNLEKESKGKLCQIKVFFLLAMANSFSFLRKVPPNTDVFLQRL